MAIFRRQAFPAELGVPGHRARSPVRRLRPYLPHVWQKKMGPLSEAAAPGLCPARLMLTATSLLVRVHGLPTRPRCVSELSPHTVQAQRPYAGEILCSRGRTTLGTPPVLRPSFRPWGQSGHSLARACARSSSLRTPSSRWVLHALLTAWMPAPFFASASAQRLASAFHRSAAGARARS